MSVSFITFDSELDGVSVGAVRVLDVEEVGPAVLGGDLLDEQPRDVAVLPLGVLHHLLRQVAPLQLLNLDGRLFSGCR